jgi:hypothetical protein
MAIFSKNANRAALFGKQKLYDKCCTSEVEECCYSTDPLPRPPCQECGMNIDKYMIIDGVEYEFGTPGLSFDISLLPFTIEVYFENTNPLCNANFQEKITGDTSEPNVTINTQGLSVIAPNSTELIATVNVTNGVIAGTYSFDIYYKICDDNYVITQSFEITD